MAEIPDIESLHPRPLSGAQVTPTPTLVPARTTLRGRYVELVPQNAATQAQALFDASHGSDEALRIWDYLPEGPWPDLASYTNALRGQTGMLDRIFLSIRPLDAEAVCGQASFMDIHAANGVIEIGYIWFGLELQRTRAATEALYLMIAHAMDDLGYRRMQWRCNAQNKNSRAAATRLGFRFEGIFFNHMIYKGKNRDTAWYSILDVEWPALRMLFEQWLDPSNFDANGVAKTSLSALTAARPERVER